MCRGLLLYEAMIEHWIHDFSDASYSILYTSGIDRVMIITQTPLDHVVYHRKMCFL